MATELPVRIEFTLPDGWQATPPDEAGAPGGAFVALHPTSRNGFPATLTIAGQFRDPTLPMTEIADESVRRLSEVAGDVHVRDRVEGGAPGPPRPTQQVVAPTG